MKKIILLFGLCWLIPAQLMADTNCTKLSGRDRTICEQVKRINKSKKVHHPVILKTQPPETKKSVVRSNVSHLTAINIKIIKGAEIRVIKYQDEIFEALQDVHEKVDDTEIKLHTSTLSRPVIAAELMDELHDCNKKIENAARVLERIIDKLQYQLEKKPSTDAKDVNNSLDTLIRQLTQTEQFIQSQYLETYEFIAQADLIELSDTALVAEKDKLLATISEQVNRVDNIIQKVYSMYLL
jgi:hypothetical protein